VNERRAPTTEQVQAMIDAASGANVKSGQSTGTKKTVVQVDFATPFTSAPVVTISDYNAVETWLVEVTANYFKWNNDSPSSDVLIDWIATDAGNP